MKDGRHKQGSGAMALTVEEHLWLHGRMERRAHELWLASGCSREAALDNWLRAERETWRQFERIHAGNGRNLETVVRCAKRRAHGRVNGSRR